MQIKISVMNRLHFTFFGVLILLMSSCGKEEINIEPQNPIFPLNVGNSWSYEETVNNRTGIVRINIQNLYTIDGTTGFFMNGYRNEDPILSEYKNGDPVSLFKNDEDGNCIEYFFNKDKLVHSTILYKKEVKKGDNWKRKTVGYIDGDRSKYDIEERIITCISSDTIISTPKGDFHCVGFSYHLGGKQTNGDPSDTMIEFLSKNLGMVKYIHYEHDRDKTWLYVERVLTSYSLK